MDMDDHEQDDKVEQTKKMNKTFTLPNNKAQSGCILDDSVVIIPDTPSPVFSRFAGKRDRFTDSDHDQSNSNCTRKKPRTNVNISEFLNLPNHRSMLSQNYSEKSNIRDNSKNSEIPSRKYFNNSSHNFCNDGNKKSAEESSKYFNDLWDDWYMAETDSSESSSVPSFVKSTNKINHKTFQEFDDCQWKSGEKDDSKTFIKRHKSKNETVTRRTDGDNHIFVEPKMKNVKSDRGQTLTTFINEEKSISSQSKPVADDIKDKFSQLRMARMKKLNKSQDSSDFTSADEYMELPMPNIPQRKIETSPKFRFNHLRWPSDSESETDSDSSDTVPLREILGGNSSEKRKKPNRKVHERFLKQKGSDGNMMEKKPTHETNIAGRNHILQRKNSTEKYFCRPKLGTKRYSPSKSPDVNNQVCKSSKEGSDDLQTYNFHGNNHVRNLSGQDVSTISISSSDSPEVSHKRKDTEELSPPCSEFSPQMPESGSAFRPTFLSPRLPMPGSVRRGRHSDRRPERNLDDQETDLSPAILISSQVLPSANVSPTRRDPHSLSPHLLHRARSARSHKGRLLRPRNISHDRITSLSTPTEFVTASSMISPRTHDAAQHVHQQKADEDYARRLQEEMDMEFAMSLHNMENRPPMNPAVSFEDSTDSSSSPSSNPRLYGLEDIEAFLHLPEEAVGTSNLEQMLRATMTATPPRIRNRQRGSRRQRASSSLEALSRMEAHLLSILGEYSSPSVRGQNRRGRGFFPSPGDDGQDYEELLNLAEMLGEVKQRGLTKHQVTKLPERKYQICPGEEVKECLVCMCEFEDKDQLRILPCFHEFHSPCIDKWIMGNATCPICRVEVQI